jgi:asparagine synthase (glutamine-hydrolysing)
MCGIAGLMTLDGAPPEVRLLDRLAGALAHRGPDGRGFHLERDVGLVHLRLAIIDLNTGAQPLVDEAGLALVANAEIYNYRELRAGLGAASFRTASDCEVPLKLYARQGLEFAAALRGMYALALHDQRRNRLVLARDPFGIKPLYFAETARGFAFASEPRALLAAGLVEPRLNARARDELFAFQFTTGAETIFEGISRVLPGELLVVERGRIVERRRRAALPASPPADLDEGAALERLDAVLRDSIELHQRSDVPYGMFLSAGIDSSAVLAAMTLLNERPVRAYTIGFPGAEVHDERRHARDLARALGAEHVEVSFEPGDFWGLLPEVAAALDDPAADYATVPTYKLSQLARRDLKVVLSGEGGDEMFAGYGRYRALRRPLWRGGPKAIRARHPFAGLGLLRQAPRDWRTGVAAAEEDARRPGWDRLQCAQASDCADWLPNDLLAKLDRCLMAHGVEGRTPFLDPELAAFAFCLPRRLKVRRGQGKWLLRTWLAQHAAAAQPFARKRGFTVPVARFLAEEGARLGPLLALQPSIRALCQPGAVERACAEPGEGRRAVALWRLLFYALWHRRHIEGAAPAGDVFETLATPA